MVRCYIRDIGAKRSVGNTQVIEGVNSFNLYDSVATQRKRAEAL